jgi:hypothetical protein
MTWLAKGGTDERKHGGSLRIQKRDGTFVKERTYPRSQDPRRSPG